MTGPVSGLLERELQSFLRQSGVSIWLDREGLYTRFVDDLVERTRAGDWPYPVVAFRGSYLELMLQLEDQAAGMDNVPLLLHMPGHHEESIKTSPVFDLYRSGKRFRKALNTLVEEAAAGLATADEIAAFLAEESPTLQAADAWLMDLTSRQEGGLRARLSGISLPALLEDLLGPARVLAHEDGATSWDELWDHLQRKTGLSPQWRQFVGATEVETAAEVGDALAGWALCVEYVHDLARQPAEAVLQPLRDLSRPLVETCKELAVFLRTRQEREYVRIADAVEGRLGAELEHGKAEDLGCIDTFRKEEGRMLRAALEGLDEERWADVSRWAQDRLDGKCFWASRDRDRLSAWRLVAEAARLGEAIGGAVGLLDGAQSIEDAVELYSTRGSAVDQAHRQLEQRRAALLDTRLPHYGVLRQRMDHLRNCYRTWADDLARGMASLSETVGFLATESLQQRHLFGQVVKPMVERSGPVALFLVDALRYEMAASLMQEIAKESATTVELKPRLAELPSETAVGMNLLAPVVRDGRLDPVLHHGIISGFRTREFQVVDGETRQRMMQTVVGGDRTPLWSLAEVLGRDAASLNLGMRGAKLVIVHSTELDDAGHSGTGLSSFEQTLQQIRSAWSLLREAGVRTFVITADHGFLLLDDTTRRTEPFGKKTDPHPRFAVYPAAVQHAEQVTVSMAALGYDNAEGYLLFPRSTAVFDTGKARRTFVHGGCSLQERTIPVLVVKHTRAAGGGSLDLAIEAQPLSGVAGMHCVELRLVPAVGRNTSMSFSVPREVELSVRVPGRTDVRVELCDARRGKIRGAAVALQVDKTAELFFKLKGAEGERVPIEVYHPGQEIDPLRLDRMYAVAGSRYADEEPEAAESRASWDGVEDWLDRLPDEGARKVFAHLARHGTVTETEAISMLGSPRKFRRFSGQFDELLTLAPFHARIEATPTGKRYVREGGE